MKKVLIKICGTQTAGGKSDVIEFATEGSLRVGEKEIILSYFEGEMVGAKVKTRVIARENKSVVIERTGNLTSKLIIESGVRTSCFYSIPEGSLTLGLYGKYIDNTLTENGGVLKMAYTVDTNLQTISENEIKIKVSEVNN